MEASITNTIPIPENWDFTPSKEKFSSDHVIDAYLRGKSAGLEQAQKLILDKLVFNINKSGKHVKEISKFFTKKGVNLISAFLKINSWDDFTVLIVVSEEDFLKDAMIDIYNHISNMEEKANEDLYHLQISVCDVLDKINEDCVKSDGFILKHKM